MKIISKPSENEFKQLSWEEVQPDVVYEDEMGVLRLRVSSSNYVIFQRSYMDLHEAASWECVSKVRPWYGTVTIQFGSD